jgi:hypothetical protein
MSEPTRGIARSRMRPVSGLRDTRKTEGANLLHLEVCMDRDEPHEQRWQELAAEAAIETDSRRLMELVTALCDEFERGGSKRIGNTTTEDRV